MALPIEPLALALGEERVVGSDRTISFTAVRYSTPPGYTGARVWCRVAVDELSITARTATVATAEAAVGRATAAPAVIGGWGAIRNVLPINGGGRRRRPVVRLAAFLTCRNAPATGEVGPFSSLRRFGPDT
ncbi:Mu transposase domain-containing protein [Streptomyces sp. NPDC003480]